MRSGKRSLSGLAGRASIVLVFLAAGLGFLVTRTSTAFVCVAIAVTALAASGSDGRRIRTDDRSDANADNVCVNFYSWLRRNQRPATAPVLAGPLRLLRLIRRPLWRRTVAATEMLLLPVGCATPLAGRGGNDRD
jgi:hypothetical protein